jgi:3-phenylpropionate/trans-cinnamate dioxygenase ferredoxin component
MASWVDAGLVAELPIGGAVSISVGRFMVAVGRNGDTCFAVEDVCTHDGAELVGGVVDDNAIVCPRHGARFCLRTGEALTPPAYEPIRVFETKVDNGRLWVRPS